MISDHLYKHINFITGKLNHETFIVLQAFSCFDLQTLTFTSMCRNVCVFVCTYISFMFAKLSSMMNALPGYTLPPV